MTEGLTEQSLKDLAMTRDVHIDRVVCAEPVYVTSVSLVPLGRLGKLFVFKDDNGEVCGIPLPFGLLITETDKAA